MSWADERSDADETLQQRLAHAARVLAVTADRLPDEVAAELLAAIQDRTVPRMGAA